MKKIFFLIMCIVIMFIITGCGKKHITCTRNETFEGVTSTTDLIIDFDDDDKVVKATSIFDFGNQEMADLFCDLYKQSSNPNAITCSGTKITVNDLYDDKNEMSSNRMIGKVKKEIIKSLEDEGFICE